MRTAHDWYNVLCMLEVEPSVAAEWSEVFADVVGPETFSAGDEDLSAFLGQILHESAGLTRLQESLNYSAERLTVVWPTRFPTKADAAPYANNPEALANKVYGGRMGNTEPGDGWKYRGRCPLQVTGRDNYRAVGEIMGQDLEGMPELLEQPRFALEAAIAWWEDRIPDSLLGDIEKTTRRVNGGTLGLAHREDLTEKAREALA